MSHKVWKSLGAVLLLFIFIASEAAAEVPARIAVQGSMRVTGGGAAVDGTYKLTFGLYDHPTDGKPKWSEAMQLTVKGGVFATTLGKTSPIAAKLLAETKELWLGVTIGTDPELTRTRLDATTYAIAAKWAATAKSAETAKSADSAKTADTAKTADSAKTADTAKTAGSAKTADTAKTATSAKSADTAKVATNVQCTGCVSVSEMKFDSDIDLGTAAFAAGKVTAKQIVGGTVSAQSFVGDGSKLTGIQTVSGECKTKGEVVKGINPDGSLKCAAAMDPNALPADGLNEISNDLLFNQFIDETATDKAVAIIDNNPQGQSISLTVPDRGLAQKVWVSLDLTNSDISTVTVSLKAPHGKVIVLHNKSGSGTALKTTWPSPTKVVSGSLDAWIGKNPKGKWTLTVVDSKFLNNKTDGEVKKWSLKVQTLSTKKVRVAGDLHIDGQTVGLQLENASAHPVACDAKRVGYMYYHTTKHALYVCNGTKFTQFARGAPPGGELNPADSCLQIKEEDATVKSGLYWLRYGSGQKHQVYCEMTIDGGGWTLVAQRRAGNKNIESFGGNLAGFFWSTGGKAANLGHDQSYSMNMSRVPPRKEWLVLDLDSNGKVDDDSYRIESEKMLFPNTTGASNITVNSVCNVSKTKCDTTSVYFKFLGSGHYSGSHCNNNQNGGSYGGNFGYCQNGLGNYASNGLVGNRSGYAETKLWNYSTTGYRTRIFVR